MDKDSPIDFPLASTYGELLTVLNQTEVVRYVAVATLAILLYDHLITLDLEVQRIWTMKWGVAKICFLINRYITPPMLVFNSIVLTLTDLSIPFCGFWLQWQAWPTLFTLVTVEMILILRVAALYGNNKIILTVLLTLYCCEMGAMLGITGFLYRGDPNPLPSVSFLPGCYSISFVKWLYGYWVAPVILEGVIMILTIYKTIRLVYDTNGSPTLRLMARDSIIYFSIMFSVLVANLILFKAAPPFLTSLLIGPSSAIACIAMARMMMNLRSVSHDDGGTTAALELHSIEFRARREAASRQNVSTFGRFTESFKV